MFKRLFATLVFLLLAGSAHAQVINITVIAHGAAPVSYTGPGDLQAYQMWGSCSRAYSTAKRGTKTCNVCLPGGTTCGDINSDATTGIVTTAVVSGTACNNSTQVCTVKCVYDQTGNGFDWCNNTTAVQGVLYVGCIGTASAVCLKCNTGQCRSSPYYASAITANSVLPMTMVGVGQRFTDTGSTACFAINTHQFPCWRTGIPNQFNVSAGFDASVAATDGAFHGIGVSIDTTGNNSTITIDSTVNSGLITGTNAGFGDTYYVADGDGIEHVESGWMPSGTALTSAQMTAISANAHTAYGF